MSSDLGRHEQIFTGRGGAGNFVVKNPIPRENLPKAYSEKPVAGNFSGRGGAGNFKSARAVEDLPQTVPAARPVPTGPQVYKGGRGGAGNIEAVQTNEKHQDDREVAELIRLHSELRETSALPREPTERPILRID